MSWSDLNDSKRMMKGFMFVDALSVGVLLMGGVNGITHSLYDKEIKERAEGCNCIVVQ